MGYKFDPVSKEWSAYFSKRHPVTQQPRSLRKSGLKSKAEAVRVERELIQRLEKTFLKVNAVSWSRVVTEFIKSCRDRGLTEHTIYSYQACLNAHTMDEWSVKSIDAITTQAIRDLLRERLGHKLASHQKYFYKCVRAVFTFAVESGYILRNPTPTIKFKLGDKIKGVLNEKQIKKLLLRSQELGWEWYPHYAVALYTGMRNGELYALQWNNVDVEARKITVNMSWNAMDGFKSTKSGDDRIIEVAAPLVPLLKELKAQSEGVAFVLPRIDRWDRGQQARDLRLFCQSNELPQVRFHDLRASWATLLLSKGVEPIKVMKMGGWKDLETMMIYARKAGVDIVGATDCLDLHSHGIQRANVLNLRTM